MIVLDTHVLVWWVGEPKKLSNRGEQAIKKAAEEKEILVSSISVWEIYMLVKEGRLKFSMDVDSWIRKVELLPFVKFVPVDNQIAAKSVILPGRLHKDPADRMIIATALHNGAEVVTSDKRILRYSHAQAVW